MMLSDLKTQLSTNPIFEHVRINEQTMPTSTLYIVGLPIGNAADISLRALWILTFCDTIACEDTRETKKLLDRYAIHTPLFSLHKFNEIQATGDLIERLKSGERVALVTDAGTPAISDPGAIAVKSVRKAGFSVVPIPGACAAVSAMSGAGLNAYSFTFAGFVPPNAKAREDRLKILASRKEAFVLYEAPHRIQALLKDLSSILEPERRVVVSRELTKKFESFYELTAGELPDWLKSHEPKGEYAILVDEGKTTNELDETIVRWARAIADELPASRAAALVAKVTGLKRDSIYQMLLKEK